MLPCKEWDLLGLFPDSGMMFFGWPIINHQKIIHLLLFLERENPFDNSSSHMILQNCSSGCCESTMILSPSFCLVSFHSTHLSCFFKKFCFLSFGSSWRGRRSEYQRGYRCHRQGCRIPRRIHRMCPPLFIYLFHHVSTIYSSTPHVRMVNSVNLLRTRNYCLRLEGSSSHLSPKVCWNGNFPRALVLFLILCSLTALDLTVKWFVDNYANARTGVHKPW